MSQTSRWTLSAIAALACTMVCVPLADAQQKPAPPSALPPSGVSPSGVSPSGVAADPVGIWSIQGENSSISSAKLTDRYYTNGIRIGWTSGTQSVPDALSRVGDALWGNGQQRVSFSLTQQIFTPADTAARKPPVGDQPYSASLLGNFALVSDAPDSRSTLGLALGVVGPWALGEQVQNGFHDLIGQGHNNGWHYQLHNEPALELVSARTWRLPIARFGGLETDALPELQAGVGNLRVYAEGGGVLRLGQGLEADYGVARIRPGFSGGDAFKRVRPFGWYVFAGGDVQAVAHDITLDGSTFRSSPSVKLRPFIGEFEGGIALMAFGARLTYTHVVDTQSFRHQKGGPHQFGSLALAVRF